MEKYYDAEGTEYQVGDIVFNPCFGDYWVVQEVTEQDKEDYGFETDLCLALNNDKDHFSMDIDEPAGFVIVMRKDDKNYLDVIEEMRLCVEHINKEIEGDTNGEKEHKEDNDDK